MKPWFTLERTTLPDGGELLLQQRDREYVLRAHGIELMTSRAHGSEDDLGTRGVAPIAHRPNARVLIGGLGMGFTLRAALDALRADARVFISELVPEIITWNRGVLAPLANSPLDDPRVTLLEGDVTAHIARTQTRFDAILLDVDNGPEALTARENDGLYGATGLERAFHALSSGGVLGVWSVSDDQAFSRRLKKARFQVKRHTSYAAGDRGRRHLVWIATRP
ncbi:hypothetical protein DV096_16195 [Bradymonadaceae bacterium TMQ3]|uniref:Spermidine synthase n=1 Tax=Lujinxingia sediminis TaxID=2480984 RepID=A0ABY0CQR0_9DELT|nr:hypothetical protein [Lujinxingia sediminis]RDV37048.1 hypothetical protein DV096_16195 [Bradymonadaceae bacterium TMQ3]RVU42870.1 hypothetical protein EA187_13600 [Lujinxingia sediminis]TXC73173.1 hypothetical protein FRC91_17140 [Bradymonadales bacterium TMQ1]